MIDRQVLKAETKQNMRGKKPSVYLVAALYVSIISILSTLIYALTGYGKFVRYMEQLLPVNPNPTLAEVEVAIPVITPTALLLILAILLTRTVIKVGYMDYCLKTARLQETDMKVIYDGFAFFGKIIWLTLLQFVFIFVGLLFLILPGIMAYYSYRQALYILLDDPKKSALACLRESKQLMNGHKAALFSLDVSFIGWHFIDFAIGYFATLPVFSVWLAPYLGLTRAGFYNLLVSDGTAAKETD